MGVVHIPTTRVSQGQERRGTSMNDSAGVAAEKNSTVVTSMLARESLRRVVHEPMMFSREIQRQYPHLFLPKIMVWGLRGAVNAAVSVSLGKVAGTAQPQESRAMHTREMYSPRGFSAMQYKKLRDSLRQAALATSATSGKIDPFVLLALLAQRLNYRLSS